MNQELHITLPDSFALLCRKWKITRAEVFGSVLRDDFNDKSDIDLLVEFDPSARWSVFDWVDLEDDFSVALGRPVDIVNRRSVESSPNRFIKEGILSHTHQVYAA